MGHIGTIPPFSMTPSLGAVGLPYIVSDALHRQCKRDCQTVNTLQTDQSIVSFVQRGSPRFPSPFSLLLLLILSFLRLLLQPVAMPPYVTKYLSADATTRQDTRAPLLPADMVLCDVCDSKGEGDFFLFILMRRRVVLEGKRVKYCQRGDSFSMVFSLVTLEF